MIVAATIGLQVLACLCLLPMFCYLAYLLVTDRIAPKGIKWTRAMMLTWCVSLFWIGFYRSYYWYWVATYGGVPSWADEGGVSIS